MITTSSSSPFDPSCADSLVEPRVDLQAGRTRLAPMPRSARLVMRLMQKLSVGSLMIRLPDGHTEHVGHGLPHAEIALNNWNVCEAALKSGDIGFGETYIAGDWTTPDLLALMNVMVANRNAITAVIYGTWWGRAIYRIRHLLRRNSRTGSKKNISAHYDIGNDFYRLWLDETMTYSSALYADRRAAADADVDDDWARLPTAQRAKNQRVVDHLDLPGGARVLEIGCGWGGFAEAAAENGLHVTGLTLSHEQHDYARRRLADAGLAERAEIVLRDYRDVAGTFDGIVSIEMFEAVGEAYWASYFASIKRHLAPGGRAVVQTITIAEHLFDEYRTSSDFIQQYIFPGGMLPSPVIFEKAAAAAGLAVVDRFAFGQDYSRTLAAWLARFDARETEVRDCKLDTAFVRTWRFYLAYCAAAFRYENTDVMQFTLAHAPAAAGVPSGSAV